MARMIVDPEEFLHHLGDTLQGPQFRNVTVRPRASDQFRIQTAQLLVGKSRRPPEPISAVQTTFAVDLPGGMPAAGALTGYLQPPRYPSWRLAPRKPTGRTHPAKTQGGTVPPWTNVRFHPTVLPYSSKFVTLLCKTQ